MLDPVWADAVASGVGAAGAAGADLPIHCYPFTFCGQEATDNSVDWAEHLSASPFDSESKLGTEIDRCRVVGRDDAGKASAAELAKRICE